MRKRPRPHEEEDIEIGIVGNIFSKELATQRVAFSGEELSWVLKQHTPAMMMFFEVADMI